MRLVELETVGFRGLRDGTWRFQPDRGGPAHVTIVTGSPSVGLTSFLDAITFAPALLAATGYLPSSDDGLRAGANAGTIRSTWWLDRDECAFAGVTDAMQPCEVTLEKGALANAEADPGLMAIMTRYDHAPTSAKVVSIPAERRLGGVASLFSDFRFEQQRKRLSPSPDKFAGLPGALAALALGRGVGLFRAVQHLYATFAGTTALETVTPNGELVFRVASGATVTRARLSTREQNALALASIPVVLGLQNSIVLLDTPEAGLSAGEAKRWVDALRAWGPDAQWIIATRDVALIESVEPAARILL